MKNMFEYMNTMIVTIVLVFVFTSIISISTQVLNARLIFADGVDKFSNSYYTYDLNSSLNDGQYKNWYFEMEEENSINTRRDYLITLNYKIALPLFGMNIDGQFKGHAR